MFRRLSTLAILAALVLPAAMPFAPGAEASHTLAPSYTNYAGPERLVRGILVGFSGEPSIGTDWVNDAVLFQAGFNTLRVAFGAGSTSTWTDVSAPQTLFNVDPMLFTDSVTGRTFAGGLDGSCSIMAVSDDAGASWLPTGNMCVATLDHQTIASGPWVPGSPQEALGTRATYYCGQASAVTCTTSLDGGITWGPGVPVSCGFANPGFHGSLHVAPNGIVFLPFKNCGGGAGMALSRDHGLTWTSSRVPGATYSGSGFDADVASTPSGWVYIGYADGAGHSTVSLTRNNGTSWSTPVDVGADVGVVTSTFHEVVAGDDDRAAVAYLGTTTPGNAYASGFPGVWDLYISTTFDAGATWTTVKATSDPVQRGWICDGGTGCNSGRNLLDFMDAQIDAQGAVLVGYADGCVGACALPTGTAAQSNADRPTITRQTGGRTLFAVHDPVAPPTDLTPPSGVGVLSTTSVGATHAAFAWTPAMDPESGISHYVVKRDGVHLANVYGTTYNDTGLQSTSDHEYAVHAVNGDGLAGAVALLLVTTPPRPTDCGQVSHELVVDAEGDATRADGRADILRVSVRETGARLWFHIGLADATATAPGTMFRVAFTVDDGARFAVYASVTDSGVTSGGLYVNAADDTDVNSQKQTVQANRQCDSILIGIQKADITTPLSSGELTNIVVVSSMDTVNAPASQQYDRAPDNGSVTYQLGTAS